MSSHVRYKAWHKGLNKMYEVEIIDLRTGAVQLEGEKGWVMSTELELLLYAPKIASDGRQMCEGDIIQLIRKNWLCKDHPLDGKDVYSYHEISYDEAKGTLIESGRFENGGGWSGTLTRESFMDNRAKENITKIIGNKYQDPALYDLKVLKKR